ncbi:MAG: PD-(D/E)XK nuclease family protein [Candidatus Freyarchaeota archaeon]
MKGIESEINKLLGNPRRVEKLLLLEKERRTNRDKLVFIGMANVAGYYWCAMRSLLRSRKNEPGFFASYLHDRLWYSHLLGLIEKLPKSEKKLLEVGDEITFKDIEKLLKEKTQRPQDISLLPVATTITDKNGNKVMVMTPDMSPEEKDYYEGLAKEQDARVVDLEEFPAIRGEMLQATRAERYPTIRWNFNWKDYVVVGTPDGITNDFVYEYKTTRNRFLMSYTKPVAQTQADLYGYFFRRNRKRVQIYITEEETTETWEERVDTTNAEKTLSRFKRVDKGVQPQAPRRWKCRSCEFKKVCKL